MKNFNGKAIYNPSGKAGEYSYWACNFYVGCSNGCTYCYCKKGILAGAMGQDKPQLKKCFKDEAHALEVFEKELKANLSALQEHGIFFSFTTDPMLKETGYLTIAATLVCVEANVPVKILTKEARVFDIMQVLATEKTAFEKRRKLIAFGFTLTGHDELEPNASTNAERIEAMKKLHHVGFKTFASIEPIVYFSSAKRMIAASIEHCDLFKVGLMSGKKYDILDAQIFVEWLSDLSDLHEAKIYLKESLQKLSRYTNQELGGNFVTADYNIFKEGQQ